MDIKKLIDRALAIWDYCAVGVWSDTRPILRVNFIKTVNLSVRSFLSASAQSQACALTYRTILAVVPALAVIFAIGRGFGFQNLLEQELFQLLPGQKTAVSHALTFVDSYLAQSSEGIFLGIGIAFLLWTVISLIDSVEVTFNSIWGMPNRSFWRKITDYIAIILILPILMICAGGLSIMLTSGIQKIFHLSFMTPIVSAILEIGSFVFTCFFFTGVFMLLPNTKVQFRPAIIAGTITAIAFIVLQWLFVTGQLYVSRYNAIYGSFSFLPLFLIWMQLVWVICITGSVVCYASQNIFQYTFNEQIIHISNDYHEKVMFAITTVIIQEFTQNRPPLTAHDIIVKFGIPSRLVYSITDQLCRLGILSRVIIDARHEIHGFQPAINPSDITINYLRMRINENGSKGFIPNFDVNFSGVISTIDRINKVLIDATEDIKLSELVIKLDPEQQESHRFFKHHNKHKSS